MCGYTPVRTTAVLVNIYVCIATFVRFVSAMASRATLQVSRQLLRRSRCMPVRLLSTWKPSTNFISTQNSRLSSNIIKQSAVFLHTSPVTSSSHIVTIQDDKDFSDRVLHSQTPVIVDFFATYVIVSLATVSGI